MIPDPDTPGVFDVTHFGNSLEHPGDPPHSNHNIIGTPDSDKSHWEEQTLPIDCAVMAQRGIIEDFTGQPYSEAQAVWEASHNGWLNENGTSPDDVGKLLELHNIPCHRVDGARIQDLMAELSQGHKVIVGVDSGELWNKDSPMEDFFGQSADHAIWVTGVDNSDPNDPKIIINDSGVPDGAGKEYSLSQFKDAWADSGFNYVATNNAPPDMSFAAGFDSSQGVFPDLVEYFNLKAVLPFAAAGTMFAVRIKDRPSSKMSDEERNKRLTEI